MIETYYNYKGLDLILTYKGFSEKEYVDFRDVTKLHTSIFIEDVMVFEEDEKSYEPIEITERFRDKDFAVFYEVCFKDYVDRMFL